MAVLKTWAAAAALLLFWGLTAATAGEPRRLVSLCLPGDQLLLELAPREEIAALSYLAADPDLSPHWEEAAGLPLTRGRPEELAALRPDLVLAGAYSTPGAAAVLKRLGVPVVELGVPNTFAELRAQIRQVARALGAQPRGEALIATMDARLARLRAARRGKERPTALFFFQDGYSPGPGTFAGALLEAAGFRNLAPGTGRGETLSLPVEKVLLARPDYLILVNYQQKNATFWEASRRSLLLKNLPGTVVVPVSFRHLACPDPANLELAESLAGRLE